MREHFERKTTLKKFERNVHLQTVITKLKLYLYILKKIAKTFHRLVYDKHSRIRHSNVGAVKRNWKAIIVKDELYNCFCVQRYIVLEKGLITPGGRKYKCTFVVLIILDVFYVIISYHAHRIPYFRFVLYTE